MITLGVIVIAAAIFCICLQPPKCTQCQRPITGPGATRYDVGLCDSCLR